MNLLSRFAANLDAKAADTFLSSIFKKGNIKSMQINMKEGGGFEYLSSEEDLHFITEKEFAELQDYIKSIK